MSANERRPAGAPSEPAAKQAEASMPPQPRRAALYLVESWRPNGGRREKVTRIFRRRQAAGRYVRHQLDLGRRPVRVLTADAPVWLVLS